MKPLGINNYGSIPHLSNSKLGEHDKFIHIGQEKILTEKTRDKHDKIFVFEKYDGSNVGIAKINNKIIALTRSGYKASTSPYQQHHVFDAWVNNANETFHDLLKEGERIAGEWLYQSSSLVYEIKGEPIIFFDIFNKENERQTMEELFYRLYPYPLEIARLLHGVCTPISVERLLDRLYLGTPNYNVKNDLPEGMVFRVERKGKVDFLAKWVRSDFKPGLNIIGKEEYEYVYNQIENFPNSCIDV